MNVVSLPYRFTLLSNNHCLRAIFEQFHYPIDLHYSQTRTTSPKKDLAFHYPIDLHYSQTKFSIMSLPIPFHYPIDLHYSQTEKHFLKWYFTVSLPYRFTLLSN